MFILAFGLSLITSSVLDVIDIKRRTGFKLKFFKPLLICLAAAYPAWLFTDYVHSIIPGTVVPIIVAGIGGVCFSALAAIIFGAVDFDVNIAKKRKKPKLRLFKNKRKARL